MPSIQVSPETFEELQRRAAQSGRTPGEIVEEMISRRQPERMSREERGRLLEALLASVDSHVPRDWTQDEIDTAVNEAVDEVRAEHGARGR